MPSGNMTLTNLSGGKSIEIPRPLMSYETEIHMPIEAGQSQDGRYFFFDNGSDYDYRICTARLQLSQPQKQALNDFLRFDAADAGARGSPFMLSWEGSGSVGGDLAGGFYPFGPDLDCHAGVWVMTIGQEQGGKLWQPFNCYEDKISLLLLTGANLPAGKTNAIGSITSDSESQGAVEFWTGGAGSPSRKAIGGIMYPQDLFKPKTSYAWKVSVSKGGQGSMIGMVSDHYETNFTFTGNLGKAALVTAFLTGPNGRANDIKLVYPNAAQPFGIDNDIGTVKTLKLLGTSREKDEMILKLTHDSYNRWNLPLDFWFKSS